MKVTQIFFYLILVVIHSSQGQKVQISQIINTTGSASENQDYSIQWSVGELALVNEMDAPDGSYIFTNGLIQPTDGLVEPLQRPFSSNRIELSSSNIRIFPNPARDVLEIDFFKGVEGKIRVQLADELGHIIYTHEASSYGLGLIEKINMKRFVNGIYILCIKKLNPVSGRYDLDIGSHKIIKL